MDNLLKKLVISDFSYRTFHHNLKDISTSVFNSIRCSRLCVTLGVTLSLSQDSLAYNTDQKCT